MNVIISHIPSSQFIGVLSRPANITDQSIMGVVGVVSTPVVWTYNTQDGIISTFHKGVQVYWDRYNNNSATIFLYKRKTQHKFQHFPDIIANGHFSPTKLPGISFDNDIPRHEWTIRQMTLATIAPVRSTHYLGIIPSGIYNDDLLIGKVGLVDNPTTWMLDTQDHSVSTMYNGKIVYWDRYNGTKDVFAYTRKSRSNSQHQQFKGLVTNSDFGGRLVGKYLVVTSNPGRKWNIQYINHQQQTKSIPPPVDGSFTQVGTLNHPIYFSNNASPSKKQQCPGPVMIMHETDFSYVKRDDVTHAGAFGSEYEVIASQADGRWVAFWKFPGDLFHVNALDLDDTFRSSLPDLPVGTYTLIPDSYQLVPNTSNEDMPIGQDVTKMRSRNNTHYLVLSSNHEVKVAAVTTSYIIKNLWSVSTQERGRMNDLCSTLDSKYGIECLPCHEQHHVLIFYRFSRGWRKGDLITPQDMGIMMKESTTLSQVLQDYGITTHWINEYIDAYVPSTIITPSVLPSTIITPSVVPSTIITPSVVQFVSVNIGINLQQNRVNASDGVMTKRCLQSYPVSDTENEGVSSCTLGLARLLGKQRKIDIIGVQESGRAMSTILLEMGPEYRMTMGVGASAVIWKEQTMGVGTEIQSFPPASSIHPNLRSVSAVLFSNGLLFVSIWLGHGHKRIATIQAIEPYLTQYHANIKRIVIATDSNDDRATLKDKEIKLCGHILRIPDQKERHLTCCEDTQYRYEGDYLFDSDVQKTLYYGILPELVGNATTQLYSDHLPMLLKTTI
jgi:hypothetical protein